MKLVLIIVSLTAICFAGNQDSLRIIQLENQVKEMELEKARQQRVQDSIKVADIENQVKKLATQQVRLDNESLWSAGDRLQNSIWMHLGGNGLLVIAQLAALNHSDGLALVGFAGGITLDIMAIVQEFRAGSDLKRASNPY